MTATLDGFDLFLMVSGAAAWVYALMWLVLRLGAWAEGRKW